MELFVEEVVAEAQRGALHELYLRAMTSLTTLAAARHELTVDEFDREMGDRRLLKLLAVDDAGRAVGVCTLTSDLEAVEWINPQLFRDRFPAEARRGALLYVGFLVVDPQAPRSNALILMTSEVNRRALAVDGVVGLDMCAYNLEHGLGRRVDRVMRPARVGPVDTQTYLVADYRPHARSIRVPDRGKAPAPAPVEDVRLVPATRRPDFLTEAGALLQARWPTFMLAGEAGHGQDVTALIQRHPRHQVVAVDAEDRVCGVALSLPVAWDGTPADLPSGWDDAVRRCAALGEDGTGDTACALSVTVASDAAGRGLSRRLVEALRDLAGAAGHRGLIAPVRPVLKDRYPLVAMAEYLTWRSPSGEAFDPWVRLHLRAGGTVLGVAEASMVIRGSSAQWQEWTSLALPGPGSFTVPGALAPLVVDASGGTYVEPNVWMLHRT